MIVSTPAAWAPANELCLSPTHEKYSTSLANGLPRTIYSRMETLGVATTVRPRSVRQRKNKNGVVRVSMAHYNTLDEVDALVRALEV